MLRKGDIHLQYYDANFELQEGRFSGLPARIIQHEYDHIESVLFTDHLSPLKKRLLKGRLQNIAKGNVEVDPIPCVFLIKSNSYRTRKLPYHRRLPRPF